MRRRAPLILFVVGSAMALAGCAGDRGEADVAPYDSGRYRRAPLVTTRPAPATAATRPAAAATDPYRLPTTNLSPAYDYYDNGGPRDGERAAYVDIGPYNPGYAIPDYDSANRALYEYHDAEYGYPYTDGFYGAPTRPRFYGVYSDWYYGPRYRHRYWTPWHRFDDDHHHRHRSSRFDRWPYPYRDRDSHDWHRRHRGGTPDDNDTFDRGRRYEGDRARSSERLIPRSPQPDRVHSPREVDDDDRDRRRAPSRESTIQRGRTESRNVQPQRAPQPPRTIQSQRESTPRGERGTARSRSNTRSSDDDDQGGRTRGGGGASRGGGGGGASRSTPRGR